MASGPKPMTKTAMVAFEVYRGLGPGRTIKQAAELLNRKSPQGLMDMSAKYGWVGLCAEYDHSELKEALGKREITRERGTQRLIDMIDDAVTVLHSVMTDEEKVPIKDRDGNQIKDDAGNPMFKRQVKASTRMEAAKAVLGIAGLVPVKRMETIDRTSEGLDAAAAVLRSMSPKQIDQFLAIMDEDRGAKDA